MTRLPPILLLAALGLSVATETRAQARQVIALALCSDSGCTCSLTRRSLDEVAATLPLAVPEGAEGMTLLRQPDGDFAWSSLSPDALDRHFGGPGSCPMQLFDEQAPQDGLWQISVGTTDTSACPMLRGQALPGAISGETRRIVWGGRFHPDSLFMDAQGMVRWSETGRLTWRGVLADQRLTGAAGQTGAQVVHELRLVSPTEVTGSTSFSYDIAAVSADPAAQAILAGLSCRTQTPFVARRVG